MENEAWKVSYEQYVEKMLDEGSVPGAAVGIAKDGQLVYGKGYRKRNEEQGEVTLDTVFGIGSITKSFTCMAIMQLQDAGKLSVHDPVVKHLPEFQLKVGEVAAQMTIHQLMTHSTGMPPLPTLMPAMKRSMDLDPEKKETPPKESEGSNSKPIDSYAELFEYMADLNFELLGAPGTQFSYSNDSYALLGIIIERVSGEVYEEYIKEHILKPAGMNHTVFFLEDLAGYDNITSIYAGKEKDGQTEVFLSDNWWDAPAMRAAGFLKSTVRDMLKYADIYRTGGLAGEVRILSEESVAQMIAPHIECEPGCFYGYGLMIHPDFHGTLLVEHGGSIKGTQAQMNILPKLGVTAISLTNLAGAPATALARGVCNALAGRPSETSHLPASEYSVPADRAAEYTGEFKSEEGARLSVVYENGQYVMVGDDKQTIEMKPYGEDLFVVKRRGSEAFVRYIRDSSRNVIRLSFGFRQIPKLVKA